MQIVYYRPYSGERTVPYGRKYPYCWHYEYDFQCSVKASHTQSCDLQYTKVPEWYLCRGPPLCFDPQTTIETQRRTSSLILNYDMKQSGERIQQLRNKNGLTQERIAETLNVDRSFYSRIEAGKKGCSIDLFIAFLNCSMCHWITWF